MIMGSFICAGLLGLWDDVKWICFRIGNHVFARKGFGLAVEGLLGM